MHKFLLISVLLLAGCEDPEVFASLQTTNTLLTLIVVLFSMMCMGAVGGLICRACDRIGAGFALGAVLGPLGWFLAWLIAFESAPVICAHCWKPVDSQATVCPYCRHAPK